MKIEMGGNSLLTREKLQDSSTSIFRDLKSEIADT